MEAAQERVVDEAEDQRIRPDPEPQTADGRQRKRRPAPERASSVAEVGDHVFEPAELPLGA